MTDERDETESDEIDELEDALSASALEMDDDAIEAGDFLPQRLTGDE